MLLSFVDAVAEEGTKEIQEVIANAKSSADFTEVVYLMHGIVRDPSPGCEDFDPDNLSEHQIASISAILACILTECPQAREPFKQQLEEIYPELASKLLPPLPQTEPQDPSQ